MGVPESMSRSPRRPASRRKCATCSSTRTRRHDSSSTTRNAARVAEVIGSLPGLATTPVEATYLAWIDVRELGLLNPAAHFEAYGLGLSDGADFGAPGWLRFNFGCTRATLDEALGRFAAGCKAA